MNYASELARWLDRAGEDPELIEELRAVETDEAAVSDRFYRHLAFGTGGLRGVLGAGTNRMNIYTVRRATQGLADYLNASGLPRSVAIAHDSRLKGDLFARETARVLAANGITAHLYPRLEPTPALSWAVRHLGCGAGVCVTASHNPAQYNGYKVYGADGCQITPEAAERVLAAMEKTDCFDGVKLMDYDAAAAQGLIRTIGEDCLDAFVDAVLALRPGSDVSRLRLVYTPLNGSGLECVKKLLEKMGVTELTVVPEQEAPDGRFPTCPYPNPEILEAMQKGLDLVEKLGADLLLATDPDCDRVGTAVLQNGAPRLITGNEMGCLLIDYIARSKKKNNTMPDRPVVVKSIVTTSMADAICQEYGIEVRNVLTGFKYIGEQIAKLEEAGEADRYLLGFEESYGYLSGGYVRDKDAVDGSMLICEMAAWYRSQGKNLGEALDEMYAKFGRYLNQVDSYTFPGADGMAKMSGIMESLRKAPPKAIAGAAVTAVTDYKTACPDVGGVKMPPANVLSYTLGEDSVIVRPSGTEPKLKVYYMVKAADLPAAQAKKAALQGDIEKILGI